MSLRFGTDGVRAEALTELTTEFVERLGAAAAEVVGRGPWLIGRDTRESGPALEEALWRGLCLRGGGEAVTTGVLPTPGETSFATSRGRSTIARSDGTEDARNHRPKSISSPDSFAICTPIGLQEVAVIQRAEETARLAIAQNMR